ncbi:GH1 family beta-glucosidase [Nocardioides sp. YIM 152315]|uniref:GH1 family beta-glucosidase n=1 Tax=Nocardioides sp. YIM 152315 TaxID=3031760 RepID=UPI0023DBF760|nr:GH1 family beta-glucosidase [Nocardioides sp. YIM 152315]MDF1605435.1 GH1 family beta-glucosidase [Nocardioides sp. YIM 152315]
MTSTPGRYPDGFVWGVSTAAYQVEGAVAEGGRGMSVWDTFTAQPGRIADGSSGAVACDHFHRFGEDVALMRELGVDSYRFSISWSRVVPDGRGPVNSAGLDFYDRLVDELVDADIAPSPTLFHWDTPQALEDEGGWLERDTAHRYAEYVERVVDRIGDRVSRWISINEPREVTMLGYALGVHAPGRSDLFGALPVAHHQLLAHGLGVQALRAAGARDIGIAVSHSPTWRASDSPDDVAAADAFDVLNNWLFSDPILTGTYPPDWAEMMPVEDGDLPTIATPLDWYGVNYYNPTRVGAPVDGPDEVDGIAVPDGLPFSFPPIEGVPLTDFGWPVVPAGVTELLIALRERYDEKLPPLMITENGCSYGDRPDAAGRVADQRRIDYLDAHLRALRAAVDAGVDVRGYFHWSILDNFEWAAGYEQRFGLVHVDFETQRRIPKDSFRWYADHIARARA